MASQDVFIELKEFHNHSKAAQKSDGQNHVGVGRATGTTSQEDHSGPIIIIESQKGPDIRKRKADSTLLPTSGNHETTSVMRHGAVPDREVVHRQFAQSESETEENRRSVEEDPLDQVMTSEEDAFENIQLQLDIIKSLREQSWTMGKKLDILRLARSYVHEHSVKLNKMDHLRESRIRLFRRMKRQFQNFIVFFIPWEKRIRKIQGHFGAGIGSFFLFLRSLVWVNTLMFLFVAIFVIAPQLLSPSTATKIPKKLRPSAEHLTTILDAKGFLEYSFLFYGYYGNQYIQVGSVHYPLPLAYLIVFLGTYLFSIFSILRAMVQEQNKSKSSGQHNQYKFGWRVFTAWDFLITEKETADNKVASITTGIKEQILEEVELGKKENKHLLFFLRVVANILVLFVLGGSGYAIFWVVKRSDDRRNNNSPPTILEQYEISIAMTGLNLICPNFFVLIGLMEKYHPRVALHWELTRIMVMYLGNLYVLLISLLNKINESKESVTGLSQNTTLLHTTMTSGVYSTIPPSNSTGPLSINCWETTVGQELFKISVIDLVALVISVVTGDLLVALMVRFLNCCPGRMLDLEKMLGYPEFKLAENVLQLIYSQGLIWMAIVFSPGIIIINLLKSVIIMYIRSWAVMVTNVPPKRIFKASHQFYLVLLLLMLFLCLLAVGYAMVELEPSQGCGPFRGKKRMYLVMTEAVDNAPAVVNTLLDYLSGPSVIIPLLIVMMIAIFYYKSKASSYRKMNRDLLMQLQYERTEDRKRITQMADDKKGKGKAKEVKPSSKYKQSSRTKPENIRNQNTLSVQAQSRDLQGWRSADNLVSSKPVKRHAQKTNSDENLPFVHNDVIANELQHIPPRMRNEDEEQANRRAQRKDVRRGSRNYGYAQSTSTNDEKIDIVTHSDKKTSASATADQRSRNKKQTDSRERSARRREFHHYLRRRRGNDSSDCQADDSDTDIKSQSSSPQKPGTQPTQTSVERDVTEDKPGTYSIQKSLEQDVSEEKTIEESRKLAQCKQDREPSRVLLIPSERPGDWGGSLGDMFGNDLQEDFSSSHSNLAFAANNTRM